MSRGPANRVCIGPDEITRPFRGGITHSQLYDVRPTKCRRRTDRIDMTIIGRPARAGSRRSVCRQTGTRHRASTSMYSLTFCVRVMSPERHHWKPAVQAAAVMSRTPPVDGQPATPASHIWLAILRTPPVTRRSPASSARTPRRAFALCRHITGWTQACD